MKQHPETRISCWQPRHRRRGARAQLPGKSGSSVGGKEDGARFVVCGAHEGLRKVLQILSGL